MNNIIIIDYGSGNIKSVFNALNAIINKKSESVTVSSFAKDLKRASHIILPGVGSFKSCIDGLKATGIHEHLSEIVFEKKIPFLGICVGMQMLATRGFEKGDYAGLDWIKGEVRKINVDQRPELKIPHMGWNKLNFKIENDFIRSLKKRIKYKSTDEISAYFVHSYNFYVENNEEQIITANYGEQISAMISKENIIGTQFHPEKSHHFGLEFLKTFIEQKRP